MPWLDDLRLALRMLRRTPLFSLSVILTFALVIGANTAIFSLVNAMLFQPLPIHAPGRLVRLVAHSPIAGAPSPFPWSYPDFDDYRASTREVFAGTSIFAFSGFSLRHHGELTVVHAAVVSGSFFQTMGLHPLLGRTLIPADDSQAVSTANIVISKLFWSQEFNSNPAIVGRQVMLNKKPCTVVGVVAGGRVFQALGNPNMFVPVHVAAYLASGNSLTDRSARWIGAVYARLKPGVSVADAQQLLDFETSRLGKEYPDNDGKLGLQVTALKTGTFADLMINDRTVTVRVTELLWLAVILILCIACANILNLFLTRSTERLREIALRSALGASNLRLARQLLTESGVLCVLGGIAGVILGFVALAYARRFPTIAQVAPAFNPRILGYAAVLTLGSALLFGLAPMAAVAGKNLSKYLNVIRPTPSRRQQRQRRILSVGQIALSMALLVATGLMLHTLITLRNSNMGFNPSRVLVAEMDFSNLTGGVSKPPADATLDNLRGKITRIPGISGVGFADKTPLDGISMSTSATVPGFTSPSGVKPSASYATVGPGYFRALGTRLLMGRDFTEIPPDQHNAVLVNQAMVNQYWNGHNPVGRSFNDGQETLRVVGVVPDIRENSPAEKPGSFFYYRYPAQAGAFVQMVIHTTGPQTAEFQHTIVQVIQRTVPGLPAVDMESMQGRLQGMLASRTNILWALGVFGLIALLITAVGIFSVVYYNVTLRYREFAMRMALGAKPSDIRRLVFAQVLKFSGIGILIGFVLSVIASRLLQHYLFGVATLDPASFVAVVLLMSGIAILAGVSPAWRASRVEPARVLHDQ